MPVTLTPAEIDALPLEQGTVKWFNDQKGWGFILPDRTNDDVFVHHSRILAQPGRRTLVEKQRVEFRASRGDKGRSAVEVRVL